MHIVYKDISEEFCQLLQSCMNKRDAVKCINVTQTEMAMLLSHRNSHQFLGDYVQKRKSDLTKLENEQLNYRRQLERVTTQAERQALFDKISDAEEKHHAISSFVPREIIQSGIRIVVTLNG